MLVILLIRGLTLPGAANGIHFYLYPNIRDLANLEVFYTAITWTVMERQQLVVGNWEGGKIEGGPQNITYQSAKTIAIAVQKIC